MKQEKETAEWLSLKTPALERTRVFEPDGGEESQAWEHSGLADVLGELLTMRETLLGAEATAGRLLRSVHQNNRASLINFIHYLALRQHDLRSLQEKLAQLGLSSLGRCEAHVLANLEATLRIVSRLLDRNTLPLKQDPLGFAEGAALIRERADRILGKMAKGQATRIMVTLPSAAADDPNLTLALVRAGATCLRINTAHGDLETWRKMVTNIRAADRQTGRNTKILFDLAGPKLRTGKNCGGPGVIKIRPCRDVYGKVLKPAKVILASVYKEDSGCPHIPISPKGLARLREGLTLSFRDRRGSKRKLRVRKQVPGGWQATTDQTCYLSSGILFKVRTKSHSKRLRMRSIPRRPLAITLREGDVIHLTRPEREVPGATPEAGRGVPPAQVPISPPEIFDAVKKGQPVWFDDGKIGGIIQRVTRSKIVVEITHARKKGESSGKTRVSIFRRQIWRSPL